MQGVKRTTLGCSLIVCGRTCSVSVGHCVYARDVKALFKSFHFYIPASQLCTPHPLQALVQWRAPQMLINVMESQGELTEKVLFCVRHLLPSLMSN